MLIKRGYCYQEWVADDEDDLLDGDQCRRSNTSSCGSLLDEEWVVDSEGEEEKQSVLSISLSQLMPSPSPLTAHAAAPNAAIPGLHPPASQHTSDQAAGAPGAPSRTWCLGRVLTTAASIICPVAAAGLLLWARRRR
jgi:hypothetical protein